MPGRDGPLWGAAGEQPPVAHSSPWHDVKTGRSSGWTELGAGGGSNVHNGGEPSPCLSMCHPRLDIFLGVT